MPASDIERHLISRLEAASAALAGMAVYGLTKGTLMDMENALSGAGGGIAVVPKSSPGLNPNLGKPAAGVVFEVVITMNPANPPMHIMDAAKAAQAALFASTPYDPAGVALSGAVLTIGEVDYAIMETRDRQPVLRASFTVSVAYARH